MIYFPDRGLWFLCVVATSCKVWKRIFFVLSCPCDAPIKRGLARWCDAKKTCDVRIPLGYVRGWSMDVKKTTSVSNRSCAVECICGCAAPETSWRRRTDMWAKQHLCRCLLCVGGFVARTYDIKGFNFRCAEECQTPLTRKNYPLR